MIREGRSPSQPWLPSDRLLAIALTLHEKSRAPCGHFYDECYDEDASGWDAAEVHCAACAAIEKHQAKHDKPRPGVKVFAERAASYDASDEVSPEFG